MQIKNITEETLPLNKLTHLRLQLEDTERLKGLVELLNERKKIIAKEDLKKLTTYDANERKVQLVKTDLELAKIHTAIIRKQQYIAEHKKVLVKVLVEMQANFQVIYDRLAQAKNDRDDAKELFEKFDLQKCDDNWEVGIDFYLRAKNLLDPPEEEAQPTLSKVE